MARETHKCTVEGVSDKCPGRLSDVAKMDAGESPLPKNLVDLPSKTEPADHWSPTQQDVDAYIQALEYELSHGRDSSSGCPDKEHARAKAREARPTNSFSLFWGFVAPTVGCLWWLAKMISKTLN